MPPAKSKTPYAVLTMLALGDKSGYDIRRALRLSTAHFWSESNGQLYPALRRLVRSGLVATQGASRSSGRRKVIYRVTTAGRAELSRWLERPASPPVARNEMLLKLFAAWNAPADVTLRVLRGFRRQVAGTLHQFAAIEPLLAAERKVVPEAELWLLTLRAGQLVSKARLQWCDEALASVARLKGHARRQRSGVAGEQLDQVLSRVIAALTRAAS